MFSTGPLPLSVHKMNGAHVMSNYSVFPVSLPRQCQYSTWLLVGSQSPPIHWVLVPVSSHPAPSQILITQPTVDSLHPQLIVFPSYLNPDSLQSQPPPLPRLLIPIYVLPFPPPSNLPPGLALAPSAFRSGASSTLPRSQQEGHRAREFPGSLFQGLDLAQAAATESRNYRDSSANLLTAPALMESSGNLAVNL